MLTPAELTFVLAGLLVLTTLLYIVPSCSDPTCVAAHSRHEVADRAKAIEREHHEYHDSPHPTCALCQARKRE